MKQLNGETISTSQYIRSAFLLPEPREMMFSLPPEVVPARRPWPPSVFGDEFFGASCSRQQAARQPIHVQTTVPPPPGIQSLSGSFYGGQQTTDSASDNASGASTTVSSNGPKGDLYKTELCRTYEECGTCRYGDKCQFAHGFGELRNVSRHPKYKTDLCRTFHTSGFCPYGARCHFIHGEQEKQPQQQQPQTTATLSSSALLRQQQVPVASRRPEVLDLLPASRQNEFANTVSLLLSLTGQNQRVQQQQQPAQVRQVESRQSQVPMSSSTVGDVATYELLRMMVEQQLSLAQSKSALSPCPSPTISQYGSVCSAGSADDIPSPVCSPSSSSLSSLSSSYGGNWNALFKQQASFDSLSSYSNSSGDGCSSGSSSNRRTPPGTPDSPTMHWQDRDIASDFRLWPSVGYSTYDDSLLKRQNSFQTKSRSDLLLGSKAVRSIFQ